MSDSATLKPKQMNAVKLLAAGTPASQVAARLEITTMTLWRWQKLPAFEQTLQAVSHSGLDEIAKKTNVVALTALEVLQEILCDMMQPTIVHLKAAAIALRAMPATNGMLEKSLQHRDADFDIRKRFGGPAFTYDSAGNPCRFSEHGRSSTAEAPLPDGSIPV